MDEVVVAGEDTALLDFCFRPKRCGRTKENAMEKRYDNVRVEDLPLLMGRNSERHSGMVGPLVSGMYKRKAERMLPVNTDESTGEKPGGSVDWYDRMWKMKITDNQHREKDPPTPFDEYLVPRFSSIKRGTRLTPERLEKMQIGELLWPREREMLVEILYRREAALAWSFDDVGKIEEEVTPPVKIRTVPHEAWQAASFPIPKKLNSEVVRMLRERLKNGVLEPCSGPYRNPWFLVKKKEVGTYRLVNAVMKMNAVTVRDAYIPPSAEEFAAGFAGMKVGSVMDFYSGYDQVTLHPESRDMTGFQTPLGLLRMTTLPQGATNSVGQFCRIGRKILEKQIPDQADVFVDDVAVKGPTTDYGGAQIMEGVRQFVFEHLMNLHDTLVSIELAGACVNANKSQFGVSGIKIVGYVCDSDGMHPEAAKIAKIVDWPPCTSLYEARAFIGVCVYYRAWIKDFAAIASPIYDLFKKNKQFEWGPAQQEAMDRLKIALTTAPALKSVEYGEDTGEIVVSTDASKDGWGGTLSQRDKNGKLHPCRYESGKWSSTEQLYDAGKRECRAVLKMLKKCRFYLYGVRFTLEVDAKTLVAQLNRTATDLPGALVTGWLAWIQLFDFDVKHVPGKKHTAADGLSRRPSAAGEGLEDQDIDDFVDAQLACIEVCSGRMVRGDHMNEIRILKESYSARSEQIAQYLTTLKRPEDIPRSVFHKWKKHALQFVVQNDHLFRQKSKNVPLRRVVDDERTQREIIRAMHDGTGHKGRETTYHRIAQRYWWQGMWQQVKIQVRGCDACQRRRSNREEEEMHPTWTSSNWEKVYLDVCKLPNKKGGKKCAVFARTDLSGWIEGRPLRRAKAANVAQFLYEDVICRHGCFRKLICDGGPENKEAVQILAERYGIKRIVISPYHPEANGLVESGHKPVVDALSKFADGGEDWEPHFHSVLMADCVSVRSSTGETPFRLEYGYDAVLPIELLVPTWQTLPWYSVSSRSDLLHMRARQLERRDEDLEEAAYHLQRIRMGNKELFDETRVLVREPPEIGDLVLLHDTKLKTSHSAKLRYRWLGPYRVRDKNAILGTYWLEELDGTPFRSTFNGSRLKKFFLRPGSETIRVERGEEEREGETESEKTEENVTPSQLEGGSYDSSANERQWIPPDKDFAVVVPSLTAHFDN